ncbi:MAG: tRNA-intron lyase [Candidatus Aenigmatarchaeota archaeon]
MPGRDLYEGPSAQIDLKDSASLKFWGVLMQKARIEDGKITVEEDPEEVFQLGGYGKLESGGLILKPVEAMSLLQREKIEVVKDGENLTEEELYKEACSMTEGFHEELLVYQDMRRRGFVVRPGYSFPCDLRVYERGTSFDEDEKKLNHVKWLVDVVRTDSDFSLVEKIKKVENADNIRAKLALGIVDEEGDVTYYEVDKEKKLNSKTSKDLDGTERAKGFLDGNTVTVWENLEGIYEPHYFGKKRKSRIELNLMEAVFLAERDKLEVARGEEKVTVEELLEIAREKDIEFEDKYKVYEDLREKGFLVKCGFKFGTHFRVYDRGVELKRGQKSPDEHTKWVVHAVPSDEKWSYPELSRFVRLALNIRSKPTLGVVDKSKKYYRIRRIKP